MVDGKNSFDQPIKADTKHLKTFEKLQLVKEMTTGCLLDYNFFIKHYKMISIDLSKQQALEADSKAIQCFPVVTVNYEHRKPK